VRNPFRRRRTVRDEIAEALCHLEAIRNRIVQQYKRYSYPADEAERLADIALEAALDYTRETM
jgi:uncharacterized protein YutE (UPF0331/DUF86 family)